MKGIFIVSTLCLLASSTWAQGCSDAGFCSIGNLAQQSKAKQSNSLTLHLPIGVGDYNVFVFTPGLEYIHHVSSRWMIQGKLTANHASGNLGDASGIGDLYLSGTHYLSPQASWNYSVTLGAKLPLNRGNLKEDNRSLPMQYQSSLGTIDLIVGVAAASDRWQIAAGWQQPLSGMNRNNFLPVYWNNPSANVYPPSNDLNRKGDVLLRAVYSIVKKPGVSLDAGLLGIYHLGEDTYVNANESMSPIAIAGSRGLTLNATASVQIPVSPKMLIGVLAAAPLVVRDIRPDGLTRQFVISPSITWKL